MSLIGRTEDSRGTRWTTKTSTGATVVAVLAVSILGTLAWRSTAGHSSEVVQYSAEHVEAADHLRALLEQNPDPFSSADRSLLGQLDYLADVGYVLEGTATEILGPPIEIVEGLSVYDPTSDELPGADVSDFVVTRRFDALAAEPMEALILEGETLQVRFSSGLLEKGKRYQFFLTSNAYAMLVVDVETSDVVPGMLSAKGNGGAALATLLDGQADSTAGQELLLLTEEFHLASDQLPADSRLSRLMGDEDRRLEGPIPPTDQYYPTVLGEERAATSGLAPFEILIIAGDEVPKEALFSLRGRRELDSWAQIHPERRYAVISGYTEPGDLVQILAKDSSDSTARTVRSLDTPEDSIRLPVAPAKDSVAAIVDLRTGAAEVVRVFSTRAEYLEAIRPLMPLLNVAVPGAEPEERGGSEQPPVSVPGRPGSTTTTIVDSE